MAAGAGTDRPGSGLGAPASRGAAGGEVKVGSCAVSVANARPAPIFKGKMKWRGGGGGARGHPRLALSSPGESAEAPRPPEKTAVTTPVHSGPVLPRPEAPPRRGSCPSLVVNSGPMGCRPRHQASDGMFWARTKPWEPFRFPVGRAHSGTPFGAVSSRRDPRNTVAPSRETAHTTSLRKPPCPFLVTQSRSASPPGVGTFIQSDTPSLALTFSVWLCFSTTPVSTASFPFSCCPLSARSHSPHRRGCSTVPPTGLRTSENQHLLFHN